MPKIRFIVDTVSSARDVNGNRYHFADITSVRSGRRLRVLVDGASNARVAVKRALALDWSEIHSTESEIPKRQWQEASKVWPPPLYEHDVSEDTLRELERG